MKDNITDWALEQYRQIYKDDTITKQDIFYYTYGILHHVQFRRKYQVFLVRGLPNIPMAPDFHAFCTAGRKLAQLHLNFDSDDVPRYDLGAPMHAIPDAPRNIRFGRKPSHTPGPKTVDDPSTILLDGITVYNNIPLIQYKVNGRTPIGWFVDRYRYKEDRTTGITNYPLEGVAGEKVCAIIERLVHVGIQSDKIIDNLPEKFEGTTPKHHTSSLDSFT